MHGKPSPLMVVTRIQILTIYKRRNRERGRARDGDRKRGRGREERKGPSVKKACLLYSRKIYGMMQKFKKAFKQPQTMSFTDRNHCSEMIIFKPILTNFKSSFVFLRHLGQ
jgi:hypothetical protein